MTSDRRTVISVLRHLGSLEGQSNTLPLWEDLRSLGDDVPARLGRILRHRIRGKQPGPARQELAGAGLAWQERQPDPERWEAC